MMKFSSTYAVLVEVGRREDGEGDSVKWSHLLLLDKYNLGPLAPYTSWMILEKA